MHPRTEHVFDADSHIMETRDWLASFADATTRERLRPFDRNAETLIRQLDQAVAGHRERQGDPARRERAEQRVHEDKGWLALGAFDARERSRVLDLLAIERQLVFSSFSLGQFMFSRDPELVAGGTSAHNRGMASFCAEDPRLVAVGYVSLEDPEAAARATDDAIRLGCRAIHVRSQPPRAHSPTHPALDGVWARLAEAHVPLMLHLGGGNLAEPGRKIIPLAFQETGRPPTEGFLGGESMRSLDYMAVPHPVEIFLAALIFDGVFERFPGLRCGVIEQGALWLVPFLRRLDVAQAVFRRSEPHLQLPLRASEYLRRQVKVTAFPREPVGWIVEQVGAELLMFSTDFPHPEGGRDPFGLHESMLASARPELRERYYWRNFSELFD